jgi:tetratricopeptide (TPR) repeat protein
MKRYLAAMMLALPATVLAQAPDWNALSDQAIALYRKGDYANAQVVAARALDAATAAHGPDHPAVATALNNQAAIYRKQGNHAAAEPLYARSLAIREKALGPAHPDVAVSLNNLAALHDAQDHFEQAEDYYKRALSIREALGPASVELAASLNSLGELYMAQRKYEKAEPLLRRAYAIREKALGEKDPDRLATQRDLWTLYVSTERFALAEEYQQPGQVTPNEAQRRRASIPIPSPKGFDPTR